MKKEKKSSIVLIFSLLCMFSLPGVAFAATYYVEPTGGSGACAGLTPCYSDIQTAMNLVEGANDEVVLMPGTHKGGDGNGGSILSRRVSCGWEMFNLTFRGYKTLGDTGVFQPENVILEFSGDGSGNYGYGLSTRGTSAFCINWWEQNKGHAADGWKVKGITFQKATDYFGVMTGFFIAGQGDISTSAEQQDDRGSKNIEVSDCIFRGFDLAIDVAHRAYDMTGSDISANIHDNKFYPDMVRYGDNLYVKGHSFGAIRAQWKTKVIINNNEITIEVPTPHATLLDYIATVAPVPEDALRATLAYRGIVLETGDAGSATVTNNTVEYHNMGILVNGWGSAPNIGSAGNPNTIRYNVIGVGNGPQTYASVTNNIFGGTGSTDGNEVAIMDVGAFPTVKDNTIYVRPSQWNSTGTTNIGVSTIDSHYNDSEDLPESQNVNNFSGNTFDVGANLVGLSCYKFPILSPWSGLAAGESVSLGVDKDAIIANQASWVLGTGAQNWAAPQEKLVDYSGGGDFTQVQPAVDALSTGGVVVVQALASPTTTYYNGFVTNLRGVHLIAKNYRDDADDFDGVGDVVDGADGFPAAKIGGWSDTKLSGEYASASRIVDLFGANLGPFNTYQSVPGTTSWSWNDDLTDQYALADSDNATPGYSILWHPSANANSTRYLTFRFRVHSTGNKKNAFGVYRYNDNSGSPPDFMYFGIEFDATNQYRWVMRKAEAGSLGCTACAGSYTAWRNDGKVLLDTWYKIGLQVVSPGFLVMEIEDGGPNSGWSTVMSRSFNDSSRWPPTSEAAGFMVQESDTDFDDFSWRAGPLVAGHDLNMTAGLYLTNYRLQNGSAGFGARATSPLLKGNSIILPSVNTSITTTGVGMATWAKPAIIANVIDKAFVSITTSDSGSDSYGISILKEDSYGAGKHLQPYMGGLVPNNIWCAPYVFYTHSRGAYSANYRIWPYTYGWVEQCFITDNQGGSTQQNCSLINMIQGAQKFRGLMQFTFKDNFIYDNTGCAHYDNSGGQAIWSMNDDSEQTRLLATFDGNFIYRVGEVLLTKRGGRELVFKNNQIFSNVWGLRFHNNTDGYVINNRMYGHRELALAAATSVGASRLTAVLDTCFSNFSGFGLGGGPQGGARGNHIGFCDMYSNAYAGVSLFSVSSSLGGNSRYAKNNLANNLTGFFAENSKWGNVSNNIIAHNTMAAVRIRGSRLDGGVRVNRNTIVMGNWSSRSESYGFPGLMITPDDSPGRNPERITGNLFYKASVGMMFVDGSTSGAVENNLVLSWDPYFDVFDGANDGYWFVKDGSDYYGFNFSAQSYPKPMFMDEDHQDPRLNDYQFDPGPETAIYGAKERSPLLDVVCIGGALNGSQGIGQRASESYVALYTVGPNGQPDDLGPDGVPGTSDDYTDIDDVRILRMTSGNIYSFPGSGNIRFTNDLTERDFDVFYWTWKRKGEVGVDRYLSDEKFYFKVIDGGERNVNIDNIRLPYYPFDDYGTPITINGSFESGGTWNFDGWVELYGNNKTASGQPAFLVQYPTWSGLTGNYCIGTAGVNGSSASVTDKKKTIIFRSLPFRIDLRKGTDIYFDIGGQPGFIFLDPDFKYNNPSSDYGIGVVKAEPHYGEPLVSPNAQVKLNILSGATGDDNTVDVRFSSVKIYVNFDDPDAPLTYDSATYTYTKASSDWLIFDGATAKAGGPDDGADTALTFTPSPYTSAVYGTFSGTTLRKKIVDMHNAHYAFTLDPSSPRWPQGPSTSASDMQKGKMIRVVVNAVGEDGKGSKNGPLKVYYFYTAGEPGAGQRSLRLRLNCGGQAVTGPGINPDPDTDWMPDMQYNDGYEYTTHWGHVNAVPTSTTTVYYQADPAWDVTDVNANGEPLYRRQMSSSYIYRFRLPEGDYNLKVYFSETNGAHCVTGRDIELELQSGTNVGSYVWTTVNATTDVDGGCNSTLKTSSAVVKSTAFSVVSPGATRDDFFPPEPEIFSLFLTPKSVNANGASLGKIVAAIEIESTSLADVSAPQVYYQFPVASGHGPSSEGAEFRIGDYGVGMDLSDIAVQIDIGDGNGFQAIATNDLKRTRLISPFNEHDFTIAFKYPNFGSLLSDGEQPVTVKIDAKDRLGNAMTQLVWNFTVYQSASAVPYVDEINLYDLDSGSSAYTNSSTVQVNINAETGIQPSWMRFIDSLTKPLSGDWTSVTWLPYSKVSERTLTSGTGTHKIWVQLVGADANGNPDTGNESAVKAVDFGETFLDIIDPTVTLTTATPNGTTEVLNGTVLHVEINTEADTGVSSGFPTNRYKFEIGNECTITSNCSNAADELTAGYQGSPWMPETSPSVVEWTPSLSRNTTYYWRILVQDNAGNYWASNFYSFTSSTLLISEPFALSSINLKGTYAGASTGYTQDYSTNGKAEVTFNLTGSGLPTHMIISETLGDLATSPNNTPSDGGLWKPYSPASIFNLSGGDATKTVHVRLYSSTPGYESVSDYADILLDTTGPVTPLTLLLPKDDPAPRDEPISGVVPVMLVNSASDAGIGMGEYNFEVATDASFLNNLQTSGWTALNSWTVPNPLIDSETKWYWRVKARDAAGNETAYSSSNHFYSEDAPLGRWKLSDDGVWADDSGNGNNLTEVNNPTTASGHANGANLAASFTSASSQYLSRSTDFGITTGNLTISAWIYPTNLTGRKAIVAKYRESDASRAYMLYTNNSNYFFSLSSNGTAVATVQGIGTLSTNVWYHIMAVYDGAEIKLYLNGVLDSNPFSYTSGVNYTSAAPFVIGGLDNGTTDNFDGRIDDVVIWNAALSASKANDFFNKSDDFGTLSSTVVNENFDNDSDWTVVSGEWAIESGEYSGEARRTGISLLNNNPAGTSSSSQRLLEVNASTQSGGIHKNAFIIFSFKNPYFFFYAGYRAGSSSPYWSIGYYASGTWNDLATLFESIDPNRTYTLGLVVQGDSVSFSADGVSKVRYTFSKTLQNSWFNSDDLSGKVGLLVDQSHTHFDSFKITEVGEGRLILAGISAADRSLNYTDYTDGDLNVYFSILAGSPSGYMLSQCSNFAATGCNTSSTWQTYYPSTVYDIANVGSPSGDKIVTIYAKVRNSNLEESEVVSIPISWDTTVPGSSSISTPANDSTFSNPVERDTGVVLASATDPLLQDGNAGSGLDPDGGYNLEISQGDSLFGSGATVNKWSTAISRNVTLIPGEKYYARVATRDKVKNTGSVGTASQFVVNGGITYKNTFDTTFVDREQGLVNMLGSIYWTWDASGHLEFSPNVDEDVIFLINNSLGTNRSLGAKVQFIDSGISNRRCFLIFLYNSASDFWYAGVNESAEEWVIGHYLSGSGGYTDVASSPASIAYQTGGNSEFINMRVDFYTEDLSSSPFTAKLIADGVNVCSYTFTTSEYPLEAYAGIGSELGTGGVVLFDNVYLADAGVNTTILPKKGGAISISPADGGDFAYTGLPYPWLNTESAPSISYVTSTDTSTAPFEGNTSWQHWNNDATLNQIARFNAPLNRLTLNEYPYLSFAVKVPAAAGSNGSYKDWLVLRFKANDQYDGLGVSRTICVGTGAWGGDAGGNVDQGCYMTTDTVDNDGDLLTGIMKADYKIASPLAFTGDGTWYQYNVDLKAVVQAAWPSAKMVTNIELGDYGVSADPFTLSSWAPSEGYTIDSASMYYAPNPVKNLAAVIGDGSLTLTWDNPSNSRKTLILRSTGGYPNTPPADGTEYALNATLGNATVKYVGVNDYTVDPNSTGDNRIVRWNSFSSVASDPGTNGTTYYYAAYAYTNFGGAYHYSRLGGGSTLVATPQSGAWIQASWHKGLPALPDSTVWDSTAGSTETPFQYHDKTPNLSHATLGQVTPDNSYWVDNDTFVMWHFNESTGDVVDSSANGHTASLTSDGGALPTRGHTGGILGTDSFRFYGPNVTGGYVETDAAVDPSPYIDNFTVECWFKLRSEDYASGSFAFVSHRGYSLDHGSNANFSLIGNQIFPVDDRTFCFRPLLRLWVYTPTASVVKAEAASTQLLTFDEWHHIAGVWGGSVGTRVARIYLDGVEVSSTTGFESHSMAWTSISLKASRAGSGGYAHAIALIDEVRLTKNVLSPLGFTIWPSAVDSSAYKSTYEGGLVSSLAYTVGGACTQFDTLKWTETGNGATKFQIRTGDDFNTGSQYDIYNADWHGPSGANSFYTTPLGSAVGDTGKYIQYRAFFPLPESPNLNDVTVNYQSGTGCWNPPPPEAKMSSSAVGGKKFKKSKKAGKSIPVVALDARSGYWQGNEGTATDSAPALSTLNVIGYNRDFSVKVDLSKNEESDAYLVFGYKNDKEYYCAGLNRLSGRWEISHFADMNWDILKSVPVEEALGSDELTIGLSLDGDTVSVWTDSGMKVSYSFVMDSSDALPVGLLGVMTKTGPVSFENFNIRVPDTLLERLPLTAEPAQSLAGGSATWFGSGTLYGDVAVTVRAESADDVTGDTAALGIHLFAKTADGSSMVGDSIYNIYSAYEPDSSWATDANDSIISGFVPPSLVWGESNRVTVCSMGDFLSVRTSNSRGSRELGHFAPANMPMLGKLGLSAEGVGINTSAVEIRPIVNRLFVTDVLPGPYERVADWKSLSFVVRSGEIYKVDPSSISISIFLGGELSYDITEDLTIRPLDEDNRSFLAAFEVRDNDTILGLLNGVADGQSIFVNIGASDTKGKEMPEEVYSFYLKR